MFLSAGRYYINSSARVNDRPFAEENAECQSQLTNAKLKKYYKQIF